MSQTMQAQDRQIKVQVNGLGTFYLPEGTTIGALADQIDSQDFVYPILGGIIDNRLRDLHRRLKDGETVELIDLSTEAGAAIYQRSATFMLLKVCRDLFPDRILMVKHTLSNGLFCEFNGYEVNEEEVRIIQEKIDELIAQDHPIKRLRLPRAEAYQIFEKQGQMEKVKVLQQRGMDYVHVYALDGYYEYFYGHMVHRTGILTQVRVLPYAPGLVLQTPRKDDGGKIQTYRPQRKLAEIHREAKEWAEMMDTPHLAALNDLIEAGQIDDLIRINEALHEKKIAEIADMICSDPKTRVVLISGPSSSGKTTFAQRLLIQLRVNGRRPVSISLDNYFIDRVDTPLDANGEYDFESLEALKLNPFNEDLSRLIAGEEVEVPVYNFITGTTEEKGIRLQVPPGEPIIIEGIHGLNDRLTWAIPAEQKFKIYISALTQLNIDYSNRIPTTDSRLLRRIIRDARTRGYSALGTIKRWPSVRRGEEKNIFPFQENADVMFNSSLVYELAALKPLAEPLLKEIGPENREYIEARRLLKFLSYFKAISTTSIPPNSILREFIGGSCFED